MPGEYRREGDVVNNEHLNQEDRIEEMLEKAREEGREEIKELVNGYLKGIEDTMERIREQNPEMDVIQMDITQFLPPLRIFLMITIRLHEQRSSI
jgi:hypothetical protein